MLQSDLLGSSYLRTEGRQEGLEKIKKRKGKGGEIQNPL